jgi:hypothetical protein
LFISHQQQGTAPAGSSDILPSGNQPSYRKIQKKNLAPN